MTRTGFSGPRPLGFAIDGWTADKLLKGAGVGVAPTEIDVPASPKVKLETRDLAAASGDVSYTGYGFQPSGLIIIAYTAGEGSGGSIGSSEPALAEHCLCSVSGTWTVGVSANIIKFALTDGKGQTAVVKTYDADGFTLTWTKALLPTGTANLHVFAFK